MSPRLFLPLLLFLPTFTQTTLAIRLLRPRPPPLYTPARILARPSQPSQYEQLYRSYLHPLNLYSDEPSIYAPVSSPRGRDRLSPNSADYQHYLQRHRAYVGPRAGESIPAVLSRMHTLTEEGRPSTRSEQRAFLALFEELGTQAKFEMQNALHPENVSSQHRSLLLSLRTKYNRLLQFFDDPHTVDRMTDQLDERERQSVTDTFELLSAERNLLDVAKDYAGTFPR